MDADSFFHVAVKVDDVDESVAFYLDRMGADVLDRGTESTSGYGGGEDQADGTAEDVEYAVVSVADKRLYFFDRAPYEAAGLVDPLPTGVLHFGYVVEDVEGTSRALAEDGVEFLMEPTTFGDLRIAFFRDPSGVRVELIEHLDGAGGQ